MSLLWSHSLLGNLYTGFTDSCYVDFMCSCLLGFCSKKFFLESKTLLHLRPYESSFRLRVTIKITTALPRSVSICSIYLPQPAFLSFLTFSAGCLASENLSESMTPSVDTLTKHKVNIMGYLICMQESTPTRVLGENDLLKRHFPHPIS